MIKFETMIPYEEGQMVMVDITAPLYWWKDFDLLGMAGTDAKPLPFAGDPLEKKFTLDDFSHEHLDEVTASQDIELTGEKYARLKEEKNISCPVVLSDVKPIDVLRIVIDVLNTYRVLYWTTLDKTWKQQIEQLLPSSFNQTRCAAFTYDALANIYKDHRYHKLDEWREFCNWIETLPHSDVIMRAAGLDENSINGRLSLARCKENLKKEDQK